MDGKSKKKKSNYGGYKRKGYYGQKTVDWKMPIDTSKKAAIYTQNIDELNALNHILSTVSGKGREKRSNKALIDSNFEDDMNENINNMNQSPVPYQTTKKKRKHRRRGKRDPLSDSSDDEGFQSKNTKKKSNNRRNDTNSNSNSNSNSSDDLNISLRDRIMQKEKKRKNKKKSNENKQQHTISQLFGSMNDNQSRNQDWNCEYCTFLNTRNNDTRKCEMCGLVNRKDVNEANDVNKNDISQLLGKLSISNSPSQNDNDEDVWDLTQYSTKPKSKKLSRIKRNSDSNSSNSNSSDNLNMSLRERIVDKKRKKKKDKNPKKRESKRESHNSIMNTSTSTATWKCNFCKQMIPITTFVCPNCG